MINPSNNKLLNKLNVMNYHVSLRLEDESFFATGGLRSLFALSKMYKFEFKAACLELLKENQFLGSQVCITMI